MSDTQLTRSRSKIAEKQIDRQRDTSISSGIPVNTLPSTIVACQTQAKARLPMCMLLAMKIHGRMKIAPHVTAYTWDAENKSNQKYSTVSSKSQEER